MDREPLESAEKTAKEIGDILGRICPKGWGFALLMFSFGPNGFTTYISNAERKDMIKALREGADKIEKQMEI